MVLHAPSPLRPPRRLSFEPCRFITPICECLDRNPAPGKGFTVVMSLSERTASDAAPIEVEAETIPDRVVRVCSKCSRPLSVGERMFYFLEAVNTPALCRICVLEQEREITSPEAVTEEAPAPTEMPSATTRNGTGPTSPPERPRDDASRRRPRIHVVGEDLGSDELHDMLPSGARQLRLAASHYVEEGRLDEAIDCIRELASELALSDSIQEDASFAVKHEVTRGGTPDPNTVSGGRPLTEEAFGGANATKGRTSRGEFERGPVEGPDPLTSNPAID